MGGLSVKRYLLFAGDQYYPVGGWDDFKGSFDTPDEAVDAIRHPTEPNGWRTDWWHVIDGTTGDEVRDIFKEKRRGNQQ